MFLTRLPSTDRETLTLGMMVALFPSQTLRSELEQEMSQGSSTGAVGQLQQAAALQPTASAVQEKTPANFQKSVQKTDFA